MKNQYFGDINDYRTYGLLRVLCRDVPTAVCWMLTPDGARTDGGKIRYLDEPERWRHYDPELFDHLHHYVLGRRIRSVDAFERSGLLPSARYYSAITPDEGEARRQYFQALFRIVQGAELIFFDPDNGMEIKSVPFGRKHSSKYLYWHEAEEAWQQGFSLLIFQHFTRENRTAFIERQVKQFRAHLGTDTVQPIVTSHVVFYLIPRRRHGSLLARSRDLAQWSGEMQCSPG